MADPDARHWGHALNRATLVPPGVLYPILARLEGLQWLDSEWDDPNSSYPRRRYYTITPTGRTALSELIEEN